MDIGSNKIYAKKNPKHEPNITNFSTVQMSENELKEYLVHRDRLIEQLHSNTINKILHHRISTYSNLKSNVEESFFDISL